MVDQHPTKGSHLRTQYRPVHSVSRVFAGTSVEVARSGTFVVCRCPDKVSIVDVVSGATKGTIEGLPDDTIQCLALAANEDDLVLCQKSGVMLLCSVAKAKVLKRWMGHDIAARVLRYHPAGDFVAAGSPDGTVVLWNPQRNTLQQKFRVGSLPLCLAFHPTAPHVLAVGDQVGTVTLYDSGQQSVVRLLKDHLSHCTSLCFAPDGSRLFTASRDKTIQVYDTANVSAASFGTKVKAWIIVEEILSVTPCEDGSIFVCGSSAQLRVYDGTSGELRAEAAKYPHPLLECHYLPSRSEAVVVTEDQCLLFYRVGGGPPVLERTLAGHLDAVGDVRWLDGGKRFAVVTNSLTPRIYARGSHFCEELHGHTDIPGALAVTSDSRCMASAGKDKEILLWCITGPGRCVGRLTGHLAFVTALAFTHVVKDASTMLLLISVDADGFARVWNCAALLNPQRTQQKKKRRRKKGEEEEEEGPEKAPSPEEAGGGSAIPAGFFLASSQPETTMKASEASLNAVAVAPNNLFVAGGGKAKVVYVWKLHGNALIQPVPLKGHPRPITCVQFSPVDKLLVSCCAHGHALVWNLVDYQCIRTLQNEKGVGLYQCRFLNHGVQLATTDARGLLKLWVVRTAECCATISGHSEEDGLRDVWALDATPDAEYLLTGGTDSRINVLRDFTEADQKEERAKKQAEVQETQEVQNLVRQGRWEEAVRLALKLNRKFDVCVILATLLHTLGDVKGPARLEVIVSQWDPTQLDRLLHYCRDWNTHSQHCHVAQAVLCAIFRVVPPSKLLQSDALAEVLEPLVAYNSRHVNRLTSLLQRTYLLDYALAALAPIPTLPLPNAAVDPADPAAAPDSDSD